MKRSTWRWTVMAMFALALLFSLAFFGWVSAFDLPPVHVVIDGDEVFGVDLGTLPMADRALLAGGVLLAALAVLVAVPLALMVALAGLAFGLAVGVGLPLILVLVIGALVLSPLWLLVLGGWWLWRRSSAPRPPAGPPTANIAA